MATWPSITQFNNLTNRVSSLEGGGNAAASAGAAVLKSFPSQDPGGYVALSNIGVETLAFVPIRQITIALAADRTLPYVLQEIHIYNPESAPQGVQIRYLDTNRNRSEGEGTYPSFTHYTLNTHSGQMTSNFDGSRYPGLSPARRHQAGRGVNHRLYRGGRSRDHCDAAGHGFHGTS